VVQQILVIFSAFPARWRSVSFFDTAVQANDGGPFVSDERPTQGGPFVSGALVLQGLRES